MKTCLTRGLTAVRPFFVLVGALGLASLPAAMQLPEPPSTAPPSLKTIPVELPSNLFDAVADLDAAKRLGKALFWDMQLGSDGMACASCHFHAGADSRVKNQINPGPMDAFGTFFSGSGGANYTPKSCDFPFHRLADPVDNDSAVVHDTDDRMSSAGVFRREFVSVTPGVGADTGDIVHDDIHFDVNGVHTRRVEPRNTPTTINSIFLHRIFFDGRANNFFNGLNPFGETDPDAKVLVKSGPNPDDPVNLERMLFDHAATASQAVGPPGSPFEMSFDHRTWPNIGHKLVVAKPLAGQQVANDDSLLGVLDRAPDATDSLPGLDQTLTYSDLIKLAFHEKFWGSNQVFDAPNNFTQMEMNFSLFFGLSILCYESTLVSDDSRYDQYMDGGGEGGTNSDILTQEEKDGLDTFINQGACIACHAGAEFAGGANSLIAIEGPIERMLMADGEAEGNLQLITYPPPPDEELTPADKPLAIDPRGSALGVYQYRQGFVTQLSYLGLGPEREQRVPAVAADLAHDQKMPVATAGVAQVPDSGALDMAARLAMLEAQVEEQGAALRRVLGLLVEWVESDDIQRAPGDFRRARPLSNCPNRSRNSKGTGSRTTSSNAMWSSLPICRARARVSATVSRFSSSSTGLRARNFMRIETPILTLSS